MDISSFSSIQSKLYNFKGIFHTPKPARSYKKPILSHMLGYVSEIGPNQLNLDSSNYYIQGDLIGTSGIEKSYEKDLRGVKGYKLKLYDVNGISVGKFNDGIEDKLVSNGRNIKISIDSQLQLYVEKLLEGKVGSVVALEPSSGEILAIASSPSYNPNLLSGRNFSKNFLSLQKKIP